MTEANMSNNAFMSVNFLRKFIDEYRKHRCLWKAKCKDHSNKKMKDAAYKELIELTREVASDCDLDFVKRKVDVIRGSFRREHRKVKASIASGAEGEEVYTPKLWYYKLLLFLADQEEDRPSKNDVTEEEGEQEDQSNGSHDNTLIEEEDKEEIQTDNSTKVDEKVSSAPSGTGNKQLWLLVQPPNTNPMTSAGSTSNLPINNLHVPHTKDNKKRQLVQSHEAFHPDKKMKGSHGSGPSRDEFTVFGELVAMKLRKFSNSPTSIAIAQRAINDILFNLEMEQFSMDSRASSPLNAISHEGLDHDQCLSVSIRSSSSSPQPVSDRDQKVQEDKH